jgi:arylsulfatase A
MKLKTLALIALAAATVVSYAKEERPNIIFILADDWGLGDVKTYGGDRCKIETPNMDQLADDGMKFMDAHSSSSVCTPTRYGVLTGRYNWRSRMKQGVLNGASPALIKDGRETVPSFLKANGYQTAMIGKWHLGMDLPTTDGKAAFIKAKTSEELATKCNIDWKGTIKSGPNSIGFDYYWGISASLDMPPYIWIENDHFVGECTTIKAFHRPGPAHADFEDYDVLPTLTKKASEFVAAQARTKEPFFLYMPLNSPHTPISPSKAFQGKSKMGTYGDFVMETDWAIGQVIKAVEIAGVADNTLIIVTADNGCSPQALRSGSKKNVQFRMGDNEPSDPVAHYPSDIYRGHKADIYEGGHRVPYIARWDGKVKAGSLCNDPVCLVDLYATCADILGQKIPDTTAEDSVSILPDLLGTAKGPVREAVVHHSINGSFAIRQGNWKLNFCPGSGGWSNPTPKAFTKSKDVQEWVQLFDLSDDPAETKNLAKENPETVERLTNLAQQYIDNGRSTPGADQENNGETHLYPSWIRSARP